MFRRQSVLLAAVVFGSCGAAWGAPVADSRAEFSGTQGQNNWRYGYYSKTLDGNGAYQTGDFREFPTFGAARWSIDESQFYTSLTATGGRVNGPKSVLTDHEHWSIRRWVAEASGQFLLDLTFGEDGSAGPANSPQLSDGTRAEVRVNGQVVYTREVARDQAPASDSLNLTLTQGALVDFVLQPKSNDYFDCPTFMTTVSLVPEPATLASVGMMGVLLAGRRRRATRSI